MEKNALTEAIVDLELEMFLQVNAREKASCQDHPDRFRAFRAANFCAWSPEMLASYHHDLIVARGNNRNLLTLKYARMENIIPPLATSSLPEAIVAIEMKWIHELAKQYPFIHSKGRPLDQDGTNVTSIRTYLRSELETFSEKTLELYHHNVVNSLERGENLAEARLLQVIRNSGFNSLAEAEAYLAAQHCRTQHKPVSQPLHG